MIKYVWERGEENSGPRCHALCLAVALSQMWRQLLLEARWATFYFLSSVCLSIGVLLDVQNFFQISDSNAGLLQTGKEQVPGALGSCGMGFFSGSCTVTSFSC